MEDEIIIVTSDDEEFSIPISFVTQMKLINYKQDKEYIKLNEVNSTEFQYILSFLDLYKNNEYDYDPTLLNEMMSTAKLLQVEKMINFCKKEIERFEKARNNIISWNEFCKHQKREDFWILIDNGIYDITKWIAIIQGTNQCLHPGSTTPLQGINKDSTYFFEMYHATNDCYNLMKKYFIGILDPNDKNKVPPLLHNPSEEFYNTLHKFSSTWMKNDS